MLALTAQALFADKLFSHIASLCRRNLIKTDVTATTACIKPGRGKYKSFYLQPGSNTPLPAALQLMF